MSVTGCCRHLDGSTRVLGRMELTLDDEFVSSLGQVSPTRLSLMLMMMRIRGFARRIRLTKGSFLTAATLQKVDTGWFVDVVLW